MRAAAAARRRQRDRMFAREKRMRKKRTLDGLTEAASVLMCARPACARLFARSRVTHALMSPPRPPPGGRRAESAALQAAAVSVLGVAAAAKAKARSDEVATPPVSEGPGRRFHVFFALHTPGSPRACVRAPLRVTCVCDVWCAECAMRVAVASCARDRGARAVLVCVCRAA